MGLITCVDQPTDWVSSITYIQKANGRLHLCLDPCDLNKATRHPMRRKFPLELTHSHYFTKLDAHHGYWMICPWSGIQPTHNLQQPLQKILFPASSLWPCLFPRYLPEEDGPDPRRVSRMHWNCRSHHCTWSYLSRTWCPSLEPHACCLKIWVSVQPTKTLVKAPAVNSFGCLYDADGVHPDPDKVNAIDTLPAPTNVTKLQVYLGMLTYLSPFIPGLSTLTTPLCELLKKDTDFIWNPTYDVTFQHVKDAVVSDTTLWYFDPSLPMINQVDASQVGLGVVLLWNHKPEAFASKGLTKAELHYANIEREMLAVIFRAERFRTYVYGRSFTIESDHEPLNSISQKNLAVMPAQQQCMLLYLQGYDNILCYCSSKEMALPDALSHTSLCPGPDIPLDIAIHHAHLSQDQKEAFQQAFMSDAEMHALADIIITSWLDVIKEVPCPLCPYWQHHETLTIEDGLFLHGEALIVPPSERERILHQLHQSIQGITKSHLLTCGCIFWPGINKSIEEDACQCEICIQFQAWNAATPLTPTPTPSHPWQMCASNIFAL